MAEHLIIERKTVMEGNNYSMKNAEPYTVQYYGREFDPTTYTNRHAFTGDVWCQVFAATESEVMANHAEEMAIEEWSR